MRVRVALSVLVLVASCSGAEGPAPALDNRNLTSTVTSTVSTTTPPVPTPTPTPTPTTTGTAATASTTPSTGAPSSPVSPPAIVPLPSGYGPPVILQPLEGSVGSHATDINDHGQVIGESYVPVGTGECCTIATWWPEPTGAPQRLDQTIGLPEPGSSSALGINDRGEVLVAGFGNGNFLVDPVTGTVIEIVIPFAAEDVTLFEAGLNDNGDVAGSAIVDWAQEAEGQHAVIHAFWWDADTGRATDLGTLPGSESSWAYDINDDGVVVGRSSGAVHGGMPLPDRGFVWDPGTNEMTEQRPVCTPPIPDAASVIPTAISNSGWVVGVIDHWHSAIWSLATGDCRVLANDLTHLAPYSVVYDLNDAGWLAGTGFVWDPFTDTRVDVAGADHTFGINDLGQVAGSVDNHAAVWAPSSQGG